MLNWLIVTVHCSAVRTGQLEELKPWIYFQQDEAPHSGVPKYFFIDGKFPDQWIGRDGPTY